MSTPSPTEEFGGKPNRRSSPWLILGGIVVLCIVGGGAYAVFGRGQPSSTPLPTPPPVAVDPVCERVDATGVIVVGTAPNYPPFEFYDEDFQLDGFDISLMREIARELEVSVEFKDYAFDGLSGALALGEIDAAIAAITVTSERAAVVDFGDAYYYGRGAALARADAAAATITSPADFAGRRVGVERGTVYHSWAQANLVATGIVPEQELFAYEKAEDAVRDLRQDRVDVVLLDEAVAGGYTSDGALAIVGQGAVAELYAVAVAKDTACMKARINTALAALSAAGVIDDLAREFFNAAVVPVPTPSPTVPAPTPTAAPVGCIDSSQYVMDLTFDDEGGTDPPTVQPGESFTKGWRIRNSGTCLWNGDYRLNYVGGNSSAAQMDGEAVRVEGEVPAGQTYDFYVDLVAPSGVYGVQQARWQMQDPANLFFGQTVWVMVDVLAPTPGPTAPPPTATTEPETTATVPSGATPTTPPQGTATAEPTLTPPPTEPPPPSPLDGSTFAYYAIDGQPTIPGVALTTSFLGAGVLSGSAGCNTFQGGYVVQPAGSSQGAITITLGPTTTLTCPDDVMAQEQAFLAALTRATAYYYPPRGLLFSLLDATGAEILNGELQ